ncbi:uncharacterized protein LOC100906512 [Galendromus occidentalis]|uniref:Uncharacterized protein LOC100906512 n=1 Tax=Galendromus occidentalis TaxID=34638 RepID=A0AAJ6QVG5_9ACAR|nr:uncharacterized protein LOC100906512 [Galendromus occidentalis]
MDIKTLVFIDLEATHLPSRIPPFGPPRITEIALLACRTKHFKPPFRVTDRLSLCVNPPENIPVETTDITGLNNYNLENQRVFADLAPTVKSFLLTLDQPICLVAHNGGNFDFPLLKAELDEADVSWDELQLFTCDSLEAFRFILPNFPGSIQNDSGNEADEQKDPPRTSGPVETEDAACTSPKNACLHETSDSSSPENGLRTPPRSQQPPKPNHPPQAPLKRKAIGRVYETGADGRRHEKRASYKLSSIYERFYRDCPMVCHHALADCEMLFKCCSVIRRELFQFLEERRSHFNVVIPMWSQKSRQSTMTTRSGKILATPTRKVPTINPTTPVKTDRRRRVRRLLQDGDEEMSKGRNAQDNEGLQLLEATESMVL